MEKRVKSDIIRASDSIKKKLKLLRTGIEEEAILSKKRYEPLLKPLETLIDLTGTKQEDKNLEVKKEEGEEGEEFVFQEPAPAKRKHRRASKRKNVASGETSSESGGRRGSDFEEAGPSNYEKVYETDDEVEEEQWRKWSMYLSRFGPLTRKYLDAYAHDTAHHFDSKYGPYCREDKMEWRMGNKDIHFDNEDYIHIGGDGEYNSGVMIPGTPGLFELLFKKMPRRNSYTQNDLKQYKYILETTNAHLQEYNPDGRIASSGGLKYRTIISPLFKKKGGQLLPVTNNKIDYVHWNDPNELVVRLALLHASKEAGNNGVRGEIASIEEELREGNYIQ